ncbi:MAG: 23S rRNA (uracil(1939)-C(5))-methyltransferase RlmD [Elusimicrobiota bacterium]
MGQPARLCQHFGVCGGCSFQDIPYQQQLSSKQKRIEQLFGGFPAGDVLPIIPSPDIYFYRNKMEFVFGEPLCLGLRQRGSFSNIVNIKECLIFSQKAPGLLDAARRWAAESPIPVFALKKQSGVLRYMVTREAKKTGKLMVNMIVSATPYKFENEFRKYFDRFLEIAGKNNVAVDCFTVGLNDKKTDIALAEKNYLINGVPSIEEKIGGLTYIIFPYTFFQPNPLASEKLYGVVREWVEQDAGSTAVDLFCGSGGITLWTADVFEKTIGIEHNPLSVENALKNAEINGITNCEFILDRVETFVKKLLSSTFAMKLSTVIIDPPRPGIPRKAVGSIIEMNPRAIIYVSCNPETAVSDLQSLSKFYKIEKIQPVDMFPHTPHIEVVIKMVHR